jgi:hypothetical protein
LRPSGEGARAGAASAAGAAWADGTPPAGGVERLIKP